MLIRRADPSDAEELAILAERTFRKTFQDGNTHEDMALRGKIFYKATGRSGRGAEIQQMM